MWLPLALTVFAIEVTVKTLFPENFQGDMKSNIMKENYF